MKHLRFSYAVFAICAALLVYGVVQGTSRTSALFVGEGQATGQVDAVAAVPATTTPIATIQPELTLEPTEAAETQIAGTTEEPASATPEPTAETPEHTPAPSGTAPSDHRTATRAPRTTTPPTVVATAEPCDGAASLLLEGESTGTGPFAVTVYLSNAGSGAAQGVVLAFSILAGWELVDEGTFGNGQLWWVHGQADAGVLYALGDVGVGDTAVIPLALNAYGALSPGDSVTIHISVIEANCVEVEAVPIEVMLTGDRPGTSTPQQTPTVDVTGTPAVGQTRTVTVTVVPDETPGTTQTPVETATAEVPHTNTPVPTSTSTPVPTSTSTATATLDDPAQQGEPDLVRTVLGEQATPAPATPTPLPVGRVLPETGEGQRLPGGGSLGLYVGFALIAICLGGAAIAGRRLG